MSPLPVARCCGRSYQRLLAARPRLARLAVRCVATQQAFTTSSGGSVPSEASTVVLGGGVVGASVAYHLAKAGMRDVLLLESHHVATLGSTSHGRQTGTVTAGTPVHRVKPMLAYSVELYSRLQAETGEKVNYVPSGTLRLATSESRVRDFKRYTARDYYAQGDSCRTVLLQRDQVAQLCPLLNMNSIHGGLYTEGDGYLDPVGLTRALVSGAKSMGATVIESCEARRVDQTPTGTWIIDTDFGQIACRHVVNAAGVWLNDVARLSGVELPVVHVEHQFANILKVSQLQGTTIPCVIDHEAPFYVRQSGNNLTFGAFEGDRKVVIREDWRKETPRDVTVKPAFERIADQYDKVRELFPCIEGKAVDARAGVFMITPDGFPLMGPYQKLNNYWVAGAFFDGIAMAGGAGRFLADWIIGGEPPFESFDSDPNRFRGWADWRFTKKRASESYSYIYNWSLSPMMRPAGRPTGRVGGAYSALLRNHANMIFRAGWEAPAYFGVDEETEASAVAREYVMVTNKCGLVDLSYKGKIEMSGPDCSAFLDYVLTDEPPGFSQVKPMLMLSERGRIMASLKVIHHDQFRSEYILLTDPEHELRDLWWLKSKIDEKKFNVQINTVSEYLASFAVIGPNSRAVLSELGNTDMSDTAFPLNTTKLIRVSNVPCIAVRSSATGEMGWELFHNRADSLKLYESLHGVGRGHGLVDFGMNTLNTLRIEKGFKIWGREISLNTNPYEVGMENMVNLTKANFIGRSACVELSKEPVARRLVQLQVVDSVDPLTQPIPLGMEVVRVEGHEEMVGQTTSGCYSPQLHRPVSFAWLASGVPDTATVDIDMTDYRLSATCLPQPPDAGGFGVAV